MFKGYTERDLFFFPIEEAEELKTDFSRLTDIHCLMLICVHQKFILPS